VHHNAESHRNHIFGALTASQMDGGDGFPLTVFQPRALLAHGSPVRMYEDVCTLENMLELRQYASQRGWLLRAEELEMGDVHPGSRQVARRAPGCYRTRFPCVSQTSTLPMLRARTLDSTARRSPTTTTMGGSSRSTRAAAAWLFAGLTAASRSR